MDEIMARIRYNFWCMVLKDDAPFPMRAMLICGFWPWSGIWFDGVELYRRYRDVPEQPPTRGGDSG